MISTFEGCNEKARQSNAVVPAAVLMLVVLVRELEAVPPHAAENVDSSRTTKKTGPNFGIWVKRIHE